jgi:hypothetical protein
MSSYNFDFNDPQPDVEDASSTATATPTSFRLQVKANGYQPIPVRGKKPALDGWTGLGTITDDDIRSWERLCVSNTGILAAATPGLDIDLLDAAAVAEMVELVREHFHSYGTILIRTGRAPKCCIPFQTNAPFRKLTRKFTHPTTGADEQKIEFLGDGQHFVVDGLHPDTHAPYIWSANIDLRTVRHDDLPYINGEMAELLIDRLTDIARKHGYQPIGKGANGNGAAPVEAPCRSICDDDRAYAEAALAGECDLLARVGAGDRNNALNIASLKLHQLVAAGLLTAGEVEARLIAAYKANGGYADDGEKQTLATIHSGAKLGLTQPRKIPQRDVFGLPASLPNAGPVPASTIEQTLAVFQHWLVLPDLNPVYAMLGTVVANALPGDPVWLGLIGPPSSAKTEILNSLSLLPGVVQAATLTTAGLLSGTPKKQMRTGARGGLLNQIGGFGLIILKDFGSILNMRPDAKAEVLAALREIYDGHWTRVLGTDGGRTLTWRGKVGLLFGSTGVIDSHYSVIGSMGDRFLFSRLAPDDSQFKRALAHSGTATVQMRQELAQAVLGLLNAPRPLPPPLAPDEEQQINDVIRLVVRLRGPVERDRRTREIEAVYGAEGTARIGLALERLLAGLSTLGVARGTALDVTKSVAMDSVPPIRRAAYEYLGSNDSRWETRDTQGNLVDCGYSTPAIARRLGLPTSTVRRALQDLAAYGLLERTGQGAGKSDLWAVRPI